MFKKYIIYDRKGQPLINILSIGEFHALELAEKILKKRLYKATARECNKTCYGCNGCPIIPVQNCKPATS